MTTSFKICVSKRSVKRRFSLLLCMLLLQSPCPVSSSAVSDVDSAPLRPGASAPFLVPEIPELTTYVSAAKILRRGPEEDSAEVSVEGTRADEDLFLDMLRGMARSIDSLDVDALNSFPTQFVTFFDMVKYAVDNQVIAVEAMDISHMTPLICFMSGILKVEEALREKGIFPDRIAYNDGKHLYIRMLMHCGADVPGRCENLRTELFSLFYLRKSDNPLLDIHRPFLSIADAEFVVSLCRDEVDGVDGTLFERAENLVLKYKARRGRSLSAGAVMQTQHVIIDPAEEAPRTHKVYTRRKPGSGGRHQNKRKFTSGNDPRRGGLGHLKQ